MMKRFNERVVLISGATAGIGRATAHAFAREGASLVVGGRNLDAGESLAAELRRGGAEAVFVAADVAAEGGVQAMVDAALARFGRLDVAVNNAGVETTGPIVESREADYDRTFEINVKGLWRAIRAEVPALARGGRGSIVNLSSVVGHRGMAGAGVYGASKFAVEGLTRAAALEVAAQGIRINAVAPGPVRTAMLDRFSGGAPEALAAIVPMGRLGAPDEIARAILWLASDEASFVSGAILSVDGGMSAG